MKISTWYDGQERIFSVLLRDPFVLFCEFPATNSWCWWVKSEDGWILGENSEHSNHAGASPTPNFRPILDQVYEQLAGPLVEDIILGVDNE